MNVYIDEIFLINTFTNFLLLTAASKVSGENLSFRRAVCAAVIGGIYSVCMIFPDLNPHMGIVFRMLFSLFMLFVAFGGRKGFIKIFLGFYVSMFILAGIIVICMNMGMRGVVYNGNVYFDFPIGGFALLTAALTYIINRLSIYFKALLMKKGVRCEVLIKYKNKTLLTAGIFDTGNFLRDPISKKPVAVADINTVSVLFEKEFERAVTEKDYAAAAELEKAYLIPYSTVGHKNGFIVALKPDEFEINGKKVCTLLGITASGSDSIIINPNITETGVFVK